ncbi:Transposon TX1 uncharacterized 149 kDa protein [Vitis vinifera]|uniref:Transposon TX1 uncharacterized 149 kDa protein n=1 Tax=Vitis vinifera TaxID=29760 RepID=A0A438KQ57_VITVI|nr:Transposon TX1 uncharacterized 149 kDa protein [Vitis vinifera]
MRGEEVVIGSFSVSVKFLLDGSGPLWMSAVYGPNNPSIRKEFWVELSDLFGLTYPSWCVGGDFNVIRRSSEKLGGSRVTSSMRDFDGFIRESELHDPPLRNAAFTWSNMQESPVCKRLDRFLYSNEWELSFPQSLQEVLPRWTSDHWPIVLDTNPFKWGPTPFSSESITEEILLYFKKLYSCPPWESWRVEDRDKAPGPDGFTIAVFQDCWDVIKEDLVRVFAEFHNSGIINQNTNASFIVLLPKKRRLRGVLQETIHSTQGAFVQGRQILDAVLIANEIVDEKKRSGEEGVVFKIDFEKAYDHVNWDFLDHVLEMKGFSPRWRSWMRGCLSSVSYAILVNGMLKDGSRQLEVNLDKSNLFGINLDQNHLSRLASLLDCKASDWPILYLGLPLGGNPTACGFWDPVGSSKQAEEYRRFGDWEIPLRNRALLGKWLWRFPRESTSLWHQVILSYTGLTQMVGMPILLSDGHTAVLGRP